jgi:hypothetical protein
MGKAILFLVVAGAAVVIAIVYMSGKAVAPPDAKLPGSESSTGDELELPTNRLRSATADLGKQVADKAKAAAKTVGVAVGGKITGLKFDREVVEVKAGGKAELKVTRSGGDMKATKLELVPAPGSGLKATGGEFKDGQEDTFVTVEAPAGAKTDAGLTIKGGEVTKVVPVKVK